MLVHTGYILCGLGCHNKDAPSCRSTIIFMFIEWLKMTSYSQEYIALNLFNINVFSFEINLHKGKPYISVNYHHNLTNNLILGFLKKMIPHVLRGFAAMKIQMRNCYIIDTAIRRKAFPRCMLILIVCEFSFRKDI